MAFGLVQPPQIARLLFRTTKCFIGELNPTINSVAFDQEFRVRMFIVVLSGEYLLVVGEKPAS